MWNGELLEVRLEFPFNLIGKTAVAVFTLETDAENPSSKSVKIDGKTDG